MIGAFVPKGDWSPGDPVPFGVLTVETPAGHRPLRDDAGTLPVFCCAEYALLAAAALEAQGVVDGVVSVIFCSPTMVTDLLLDGRDAADLSDEEARCLPMQ